MQYMTSFIIGSIPSMSALEQRGPPGTEINNVSVRAEISHFFSESVKTVANRPGQQPISQNARINRISSKNE